MARPARPARPTWPARLAGVVAAGVALATTELLAAVTGSEGSLVAAVGAVVIDRTPGEVARTAIDSLGTADKPVLLVSVVVVCLALGALLGPATVRRWWAAPVGFGVAGALGVWAASTDPTIATGSAVAAAIGGAAAGWACLWVLLGVLRTGGPAPFGPSAEELAAERAWLDGPVRAEPMVGTAGPAQGGGRGDRRAFFAWTGTAAAFAGLTALGARSLEGRGSVQRGRADIVLPPSGPVTATDPPPGFVVDQLTPIVTPNADFYRIDTALVVPRVDVADWSLDVRGNVPTPYSLTFDELAAMPMTEAPITIACVSNGVGGDLVGTAVWQGVLLTTILERAGLRAEDVPEQSAQLVGRSVDGFTVGFPTRTALDGRAALVAIGMNGEPLPLEHGFPARLVVPGLFGYVSATKWLRRIELTGWDEFDAYWVPRGWAKEGPVKTQSRIDVPRPGRPLPPGPVTVAGVAWAPTRDIERVEVRVDEGPWREAQLGPRWTVDVWRQWVWEWDAEPGRHSLEVRATDGTGETQTGERAPVDPDGATGWHQRTITIEG
jgi:DMSO/TMAO reductase YedYZ molybdopterin-dependent catalytic subunit